MFSSQGVNRGHTWSHPWSAAPARIIPQFLMGVRPVERAWRRIAVHPQPGSSLTHATMTVLTLRGEVKLAFARTSAASALASGGSGGVFALNLTVPGNTVAEVCLPVGLLSASGDHASITLNGAKVVGIVPPGRAGQVCLPEDLAGGAYTIVAQ